MGNYCLQQKSLAARALPSDGSSGVLACVGRSPVATAGYSSSRWHFQLSAGREAALDYAIGGSGMETLVQKLLHSPRSCKGVTKDLKQSLL